MAFSLVVLVFVFVLKAPGNCDDAAHQTDSNACTSSCLWTPATVTCAPAVAADCTVPDGEATPSNCNSDYCTLTGYIAPRCVHVGFLCTGIDSPTADNCKDSCVLQADCSGSPAITCAWDSTGACKNDLVTPSDLGCSKTAVCTAYIAANAPKCLPNATGDGCDITVDGYNASLCSVNECDMNTMCTSIYPCNQAMTELGCIPGTSMRCTSGSNSGMVCFNEEEIAGCHAKIGCLYSDAIYGTCDLKNLPAVTADCELEADNTNCKSDSISNGCKFTEVTPGKCTAKPAAPTDSSSKLYIPTFLSTLLLVLLLWL